VLQSVDCSKRMVRFVLGERIGDVIQAKRGDTAGNNNMITEQRKRSAKIPSRLPVKVWVAVGENEFRTFPTW